LYIRRETQSDISAIKKVNESAFKGSAEARLVDLLREASKAIISLIAVFDDKVVGHILFSQIEIRPNPKNMRGLGLAPLAVLPEYQRRGIGSSLVARGLEECQEKGYDVVVVLGRCLSTADLASNVQVFTDYATNTMLTKTSWFLN
jgi:putative acetyltransferase